MIKNIPRAKYQPITASKQMAKQIRAMQQQVREEINLQIDILYHAAAIVLHRFHGWSKEEILDFFEAAKGTGFDCTEAFDTSMIEMCWDELGIELQAEGVNKHWYEVSILDSQKDMNRVKLDQFSMYQYFKTQIPWIPAQITASILIALHRSAGWKEKACGAFIKELEEIKYYYEKDPEKIKTVCLEECGLLLDENFWIFEKESDKLLHGSKRD